MSICYFFSEDFIVLSTLIYDWVKIKYLDNLDFLVPVQGNKIFDKGFESNIKKIIGGK